VIEKLIEMNEAAAAMGDNNIGGLPTISLSANLDRTDADEAAQTSYWYICAASAGVLLAAGCFAMVRITRLKKARLAETAACSSAQAGCDKPVIQSPSPDGGDKTE
jgi:hypothetical protein